MAIFQITDSVVLEQQILKKNHIILFEISEPLEPEVFLKKAYAHFELIPSGRSRPDLLCRTALLGARALLGPLDNPVPKTSVLLMNTAGSAEADGLYYRTFLQKGPQPGLFPYTVPNIALYEIFTYYGFQTEHYFFISPESDPTFLFEYVKLLPAGQYLIGILNLEKGLSLKMFRAEIK